MNDLNWTPSVQISVDGGTTTYYIDNYYEITGSTATKYYLFGSQRIALKKAGTLLYLQTDHPSFPSTSAPPAQNAHIQAQKRSAPQRNDRGHAKITPHLCKMTLYLHKISLHPRKMSLRLCKMSPHLHKMSPHLHKMSPHPCKMTLHLCKMSPHLHKMTLHLRKMSLQRRFPPLRGSLFQPSQVSDGHFLNPIEKNSGDYCPRRKDTSCGLERSVGRRAEAEKPCVQSRRQRA